MTASQDPDSEAQFLESGAADFIAKPINPPVLRLRVGLQLKLGEREQALRDNEARFEHLAHYDALTGLPNRLLLADRLTQAMAQTQRRGRRLAVVYLDLDGFKAVNDHHALVAGEFVLYYQPTVNLRSGDVIGVEALIRWQHPQRGPLRPRAGLMGRPCTSFLCVADSPATARARLIRKEPGAALDRSILVRNGAARLVPDCRDLRPGNHRVG